MKPPSRLPLARPWGQTPDPQRGQTPAPLPLLAAFASLALLSCAELPPPPAGPAPKEAAEVLAWIDPESEAGVRAALALREAAVAEGDREAFLALLDPGDPEFLLERSRWFDYRLSVEISDYRLELESLLRPPWGGGEEVYAVLRQSYRIGPGREERRVRFVDHYRRVPRAWLHVGLADASLATENFLLRYTLPPEALGESPAAREARLAPARRVAEQAEAAWSLVQASYGETPPGPVTLRLYPDRELLRQDSKITIPRLFNGWAEPGESIKLWLNPDPRRDFTAVLAHELVHKTSLARARNQCSWFAEGLANSFGSFEALGGSYLDSGFHRVADYARSLDWLERRDPEVIEGDEDWWLYGGMAGTVLDFVRETWDEGAPRRLVLALARLPQPEEAYVYSLKDAAYRDDLRAAVRETLGLDWGEFDALWLAWIGGRR